MAQRFATLLAEVPEHQDTAVSRPVLRELAEQAHLDGGRLHLRPCLRSRAGREQPSGNVAADAQTQEHRLAQELGWQVLCGVFHWHGGK